MNTTPLTAETSRILGGNAPSGYLGRLAERGSIQPARLDEVLETHFIRPELLRADAFQDFIRDRAMQLLDAVERATGKPVAGRDAEDVVEVFGGALQKLEAVVA